MASKQILISLFFVVSVLVYNNTMVFDIYNSFTPGYTNDLNNISSCKSPTYIITSYQTDPLIQLTVSAFMQHGFNTNCTSEISYGCCRKYNKSYSKHYCDGGRLLFDGFKKTYDGIHMFTKVSLHRILTLYCNKFVNNSSTNICNFKLLSYELNDEKQRIEFLTTHIDCTNNNPQYNKTWVFKENKHAGRGV
eukprot:194276_1